VIPTAWRYGLDDREERFISLPGQSIFLSSKLRNHLWVPSSLLRHGWTWALLLGKAVVARIYVWWRSAVPQVPHMFLWGSVQVGTGRVSPSLYSKDAERNSRTRTVECLVKGYKKLERLWKEVVDPWYKTTQKICRKGIRKISEAFIRKVDVPIKILSRHLVRKL
jgi:hypothetical protein